MLYGRESKKLILVITPIKHIKGVKDQLKKAGELLIFEDANLSDIKKHIKNIDAIFTNPNKSNIFIGKDIISLSEKLKVICTASTGTIHIDSNYAKKRGIEIISLTEERKYIDKITSTAELAFTIMMSSLRHVSQSYNSVLEGYWDYVPYIGKQLNCLNVGVIGYGRLGKLFCKYARAFGSKIFVYDPYVNIKEIGFKQVDNLSELISKCDVISIHVHVNKETSGMINSDLLAFAKKDVLIVNTSRGEIINEHDIIEFLISNEKARLATDVISNEITDKASNPLIKFSKKSNQILITPHIGGMTVHAQEIAYNRAAELLVDNLNGIK